MPALVAEDFQCCTVRSSFEVRKMKRDSMPRRQKRAGNNVSASKAKEG